MADSNRMQWNIGGWLGAQLGGSAWILVAGLLSLRFDAVAAIVVIGLFAAANLIGLAIWRRRERMSAYAGIQVLLPTMGLLGIAAIYVLDQAGTFERIQSGGAISASSTYSILILVIAALMLMFYFRFGRNGSN